MKPCVIGSGCLKAEISPEGSHIRQISKGNSGLLWQGDRLFWGSCPILFPFVGRFYRKEFIAEGSVYHTENHGFIDSRLFKVGSLSADELTLVYVSDDKDYEIYPYRFRFVTSYSVDGCSLCIRYQVHNLDEKVMHFGLGVHPGLYVDNDSYDRAYLEFDVDALEEFVMESSCLTSGRMAIRELDDRRLYLNHELFSNDALIFRNWGERVFLRNDADASGIQIQSKDFSILTIWSRPAKQQPFVCIEPCTAVPGEDGVLVDISKKSDYFHLSPNCSKTFSLLMRF